MLRANECVREPGRLPPPRKSVRRGRPCPDSARIHKYPSNQSLPGGGGVLRSSSAIFVAAALVAFLLIPTASASPTVQYGHTLGGTGNEGGRLIGVDGSGNVYQFGITSAYTPGAFLATRNHHAHASCPRPTLL